MARLVMTLPDDGDLRSRIVDAYCAQGRYEETAPGPDGQPLGREEFALAQIQAGVLNTLIAFEGERAASEARLAKAAEIEAVPLEPPAFEE